MQLIKNIEDKALSHGYYTGKDHSGEFDVAKIQGDSEKAYDKDYRSQGQVTGFAVIHLIVYEHTKTGSSDHTVQQEGDSTDNRSRNRVDQGSKFAEERAADRKNCSTTNDLNAVNFCHSHNTDVFTISCSRHRTKTSGYGS